MFSKIFYWLPLSAISISFGLYASANPVSQNCMNYWSKNSVVLKTPETVLSVGKGNSGIEFRWLDNSVNVTVGGKNFDLTEIIATPPLIEILPEPNGRNFAISFSDGGILGTWDSYVYNGSGGKFSIVNLRPLLTEYLDRAKLCNNIEIANIATIGFVKSDEVLVVAESPPHSSCEDMGRIVGFLVNTTETRVSDPIQEEDMKTKWNGILGCRIID